jgi:ribosomal protein S18 acetylase RimI-like enzyme
MTGVIEYRESHDVDLAELARLRASCDFSFQPAEVLARQVEGARWVVSAWDGPRLVGFARAVSDGVTNAYVSSVMVHAAYRRRGIGRALMDLLMSDRGGVRFVLHARDEDAMAFYRTLGFTEAPAMMWRDRRTR